MKRFAVCILALWMASCGQALAGGVQNEEVLPPAQGEARVLEVVGAREEQETLRKGVAVTAQRNGTAPLHAAPDGESVVLMAYYSGAPLQVIRRVGAFYQVQAGAPDASVMGYMPEENVALGETASRVVGPSYMELRFNREAPVYAYCDEGAQVIGQCDTGKTYYAMGKNDGKWVQLYLPPANHVWEEEARIAMGFVKLNTGVARGYWHELTQWTIEPRAGEITPEQAIALAIEHLTQTGNASLPEIYTQREALESMHSRAQYMQTEESLINDWWVYFWENTESDVVRVYVYVSGDGRVSMHHDYISVGETGYGIQMTL